MRWGFRISSGHTHKLHSRKITQVWNMNIDDKSADNSLKFYMRKKYLSTDHMEQGGNCCNGKMSQKSGISNQESTEERAPGLCLLLPLIQENPLAKQKEEERCPQRSLPTHTHSAAFLQNCWTASICLISNAFFCLTLLLCSYTF